MSFAFEKTSHISLSYKLVPVQYREYEYGLFLISRHVISAILFCCVIQHGRHALVALSHLQPRSQGLFLGLGVGPKPGKRPWERG